MEQPGRARSELIQEPDFVGVRHIPISMAGDIVDEAVHRVDGGLTEQTQRGLVQVDTVRQARVMRARNQRGHLSRVPVSDLTDRA